MAGNAVGNGGELIPYKGDKPFIFVSYPHDELVKVEGILRQIQRKGLRFWYDQSGAGIPLGRDWKPFIQNRLSSCSMFLCFLANGVEQRREVLDEIRTAINRREKEPEFRILFIFLEKMPTRVFERAGAKEIETAIRKAQYISYRGITEPFLAQLFAEDVFPDCLVAEEKLEEWKNRKREDIRRDLNEVLSENRYVYETAFPEKREGENFYRVRMDEADPDAVCLICLDNQWVPEEFYDDPEFWRDGFDTEKAVRQQGDYQQTEIFRALLNHRQVIVNRAFFYNSLVFERWYDKKSGDYEGFRRLLSDGSLLVYLTLEEGPFDEKRKPKFATANYEVWGDICRETEMYCLRLDWTDAVTNSRKVEQLLFQRFQNFCLTMAEDRHRLNDLAEAFSLKEREAEDFKKIWREVQLDAAARNRKELSSYTRESFYKRFLVREGTEVSKCLLDIQKAFVPELKEIVDFQYGLNLPEALGVLPLFPEHGHLQDFYRSGQILQRSSRELSAAELSCSVGQFEPAFLQEMVDFPEVKKMTLSQIVLVREMEEWKDYMRAVSNGRKRAHLKEVDFYDISYVWTCFYRWMKKARELTEERAPGYWHRIQGAVSLIYRLGSFEVVTVYHAGGRKIDVSSSISSEEEIPKEMNHTVLVTIDYVCADVLKNAENDGSRIRLGENFLLAEQRLFEGMSKEPLSVIFTELMKRLDSMGANHIPMNVEKKLHREDVLSKRAGREWKQYVEELQTDRDEIYETERYICNKKNRVEWTWYVNLMQERPEEFRQDEMLEIVTDLDEICRYERQHQGVIIGVRYQSPYSILLVDLVRDAEGVLRSYERRLPAIPAGAVVTVPVWNGKYVLLEQFRHAMRSYQLAFPRGYATKDLDGKENAALEIGEEIGATVLSSRLLGHIIADSGACGNQVEVYACEITEPVEKQKYEGIRRMLTVTKEELRQLVQDGRINDGYTLSALKLLQEQDDQE